MNNFLIAFYEQGALLRHIRVTQMLKVFIICSASLLSSCSHRMLQDPSKAVARLDQGGSLQDAVDRLAKPLITSKENIGLVVSVFDGHSPTQTFAYGYRDIELHTPMTAESVFGVGSVTKPLIISLLLALNERGVLSINETIGDLLPAEAKFRDSRIRDITFRQLASHTSGLPREPVEPRSLVALGHYVLTGENLYGHLTEEYIYNYLADFKLPDQPEEHPQYSNIGVGLLARLLSVRTGKSLDTLLQENLFDPLDMHVSALDVPGNADISDMLATGHSGDQPFFIARNTPLPGWTFTPIMRGTGAAYSNGPDLIKFLKAHLGRSGTFLDNAFKQTLAPIANTGHEYLTMGWFEDPHPEYGVRLYYYHGMVSGYNCYVGFEPDSDVAVVVLRNNFNWVDKIGHELLLELAMHARNQSRSRTANLPIQ